MEHRLNAYKDGYKWVTFCEICGQEEPMLDLCTKCPGEYSITNKNHLTNREKLLKD